MTIKETEYFKNSMLPYWNKEKSWSDYENTLDTQISIEYDDGEKISMSKGNLNDMLAFGLEHRIETKPIRNIGENK